MVNSVVYNPALYDVGSTALVDSARRERARQLSLMSRA